MKKSGVVEPAVVIKTLAVGDRVSVAVTVSGKNGNDMITRFGRVVALDVVGVMLDGDLNMTAVHPAKVSR